MKTCNKCGETKDSSEFHRNKGTKDGYASICITCTKERNKKLKESPLLQLEKAVKSSILIESKILFKEGKKICCSCKNIFLITEISSGYCVKCTMEYNKEYHKENAKKASEYEKEYRKNNIEKIKEYEKEYRKKNREGMKKKGREYYKMNREVLNEKAREYQNKNIEKIKEYKKEYREKNREKINEQQRQRRLKQKEGN